MTHKKVAILGGEHAATPWTEAIARLPNRW